MMGYLNILPYLFRYVVMSMITPRHSFRPKKKEEERTSPLSGNDMFIITST